MSVYWKHVPKMRSLTSCKRPLICILHLQVKIYSYSQTEGVFHKLLNKLKLNDICTCILKQTCMESAIQTNFKSYDHLTLTLWWFKGSFAVIL